MTNVEFIASFLYAFPNSTSTRVRRALFKWKNAPPIRQFKKGQYCWYFNKAGSYMKPMGVNYGYWMKSVEGKGWKLTTKGTEKVNLQAVDFISWYNWD
jgi:hypothetical protein